MASRLLSKVTPGRVYGPFLYDGRRVVTIEDGPKKRSMTYARWLMQEHLGRVLGPGEHVHHVDEDPLHDEVSNYRIESPSEHHRLHHGEAEMFIFVCPGCGQDAAKPARFVRHNRKQGKPGPFCGRRCAGRANAAQREYKRT